MKRHIPNIITGCNLLCGAIAVIFACSGACVYAFPFIILGAFFDFFDGMTARLLKVSGPLGVQMDSLADDITFGLAPATMLFAALRPLIGWWSLLALIMAAFSAFRLAKFNIDERQHTSFIGLATPANAIFWGGICCMPYGFYIYDWMPWALLVMSLVSSWLMVCEIPFFSLKFKNFSWKDNSIRFLFLIGTVILLAFCGLRAYQYGRIEFFYFSGTAIILWYIVINALNNTIRNK